MEYLYRNWIKYRWVCNGGETPEYRTAIQRLFRCQRLLIKESWHYKYVNENLHKYIIVMY